ncbi:MAG: MoxR-like ATPase, partial [Verrucomicrobiales bacterium]
TGGETHQLPLPFFVLATQNPMEMEGTYPLPEAQLDRFMFKIQVPFPTLESLVEISKRTTGFHTVHLGEKMSGAELINFQETLTHVPVADPVTSYAAQLILATHPDTPSSSEKVKRYVSYGASPRGLQALIRGARVHAVLSGRTAVSVDDVRRVAKVALRHRIILNFEGEAESISVDSLIDGISGNLPTPAKGAAA